MTSESRKRVLAFEQLEPKAAPSSILLLLATSSEGNDAEYSASVEYVQERAAGPWRYVHDTESLLRFIDANTVTDCTEQTTRANPSEVECAAADEMMKLDDTDLRAIVLTTYGS